MYALHNASILSPAHRTQAAPISRRLREPLGLDALCAHRFMLARKENARRLLILASHAGLCPAGISERGCNSVLLSDPQVVLGHGIVW